MIHHPIPVLQNNQAQRSLCHCQLQLNLIINADHQRGPTWLHTPGFNSIKHCYSISPSSLIYDLLHKHPITEAAASNDLMKKKHERCMTRNIFILDHVSDQHLDGIMKMDLSYLDLDSTFYSIVFTKL